jgi:opacity protein-like surface antigen
MKKIILTLVVILGVSQFAKAQTEIGGGISLFNEIAVEVKANFAVTEEISISPSFDYFFVDNEDLTNMLFGVDGHYNFEVGNGFNVYPLVGVNYFYYSLDVPEELEGLVDNSGGDFGLTVGGGATYNLSDSMKLYAEIKYLQSDFGISAGLLFSL